MENVSLVNKALLERPCRIKPYRRQFDSAHSSVSIKNKIKWIDVIATTFDDLIREVGVNSVNLVKIDVGGAETNIVKDMKTNHPEKLVIAAYHTPREAREIEMLLASTGYTTKVILVHSRPYVHALKHNKDKIV